MGGKIDSFRNEITNFQGRNKIQQEKIRIRNKLVDIQLLIVDHQDDNINAKQLTILDQQDNIKTKKKADIDQKQTIIDHQQSIIDSLLIDETTIDDQQSIIDGLLFDVGSSSPITSLVLRIIAMMMIMMIVSFVFPLY